MIEKFRQVEKRLIKIFIVNVMENRVNVMWEEVKISVVYIKRESCKHLKT